MDYCAPSWLKLLSCTFFPASADATDDAGGPTAGAAAAAAAAAAVPGAILLPISAVATGSAPSLSAATGMTFTAGECWNEAGWWRASAAAEVQARFHFWAL